jgi:hypothetical protein
VLEYRDNRYDPENQALQADNAKEYEKLGRSINAKYGTKLRFTMAYTPNQNGVAERRNRTLQEHLRPSSSMVDSTMSSGGRLLAMPTMS